MNIKYRAYCEECPPIVKSIHGENYWESLKYDTKKKAKFAAEWHNIKYHNENCIAKVKEININEEEKDTDIIDFKKIL